MFRINRKSALQLSVTFLVTLIICIAVFSFSMVILKKFFTHADKIKATFDDRTEREIEKMLIDGTIAIPFDKKTIASGKYNSFAIVILNVLKTTGQEDTFNISIKFDEAFGKNNEPIKSNQPDEWLKTTSGAGVNGSGVSIIKTIKKNEQERFLLGAEVPKNTKQGTYIFNLNVTHFDLNKWILYDKLHKLYVEVP